MYSTVSVSRFLVCFPLSFRHVSLVFLVISPLFSFLSLFHQLLCLSGPCLHLVDHGYRPKPQGTFAIELRTKTKSESKVPVQVCKLRWSQVAERMFGGAEVQCASPSSAFSVSQLSSSVSRLQMMISCWPRPRTSHRINDLYRYTELINKLMKVIV